MEKEKKEDEVLRLRRELSGFVFQAAESVALCFLDYRIKEVKNDKEYCEFLKHVRKESLKNVKKKMNEV